MNMQKVTPVATKYTYLCSWFSAHGDDQSISVDQFEVVLNEIGKLETCMRGFGVSQDEIGKMIAYSKSNNLANKSIKNLTDEDESKIIKEVFYAQKSVIGSNHPYSMNNT